MTNELNAKLEELTKLEAIANNAELAYKTDPMNAEKENDFDSAYEAEYNAFMAIAELIVEMTSGKIDIKAAREILRTKRTEILMLVS